ncbi:serine/threonine-protein kinase [Mesorhizobium sp.]|uniref:serine/threonine-protein kinase n=1 Tax=Mesorhizobium sp. TaxID=1871066 RepID=UPI0025F353CA|nr:serine/threonine-protein kinase [Mesorhizobium sp.]
MLKRQIAVQTTFGDYTLTETLGEGGAGRVYGGVDESGNAIALKLLINVTTDKRRRFRNETAFLAKNTHRNIVSVIDYGMGTDAHLKGPFYVMHRYTSSLRERMSPSVNPAQIVALFSQMLDGVEAAHMLGATHRDLKPENFLFDAGTGRLAVADFGIASFTSQELLTLVETSPQQRLANFNYAAPEQRRRGAAVDGRADIYALGLMLNELFTGEVPHGTNYKLIGDASAEYAFMDPIVAKMTTQNPDSRPSSIAVVKDLIEQNRQLELSRQRLSEIANTVVYEGEVTDPLAHEPPKLVGATWDDGLLRLTLDRPVHQKWVSALQNMGNYSSVMGHGPHTFQFSGQMVTTSMPAHSVQHAVDHFKTWLPNTTKTLHYNLLAEAKRKASEERARLEQARQQEETRMKVNSAIRI